MVRPISTGGVRAGELLIRPKLAGSGRPRRFPQAERRLLDELVARASLTAENVQLRAALRREIDLAALRADEVWTSRRRVVEASDAERHRALAELDSLGRGIYPRSLTAYGVPEALAALAGAFPAVALTVPTPQVRWPPWRLDPRPNIVFTEEGRWIPFW